MFTKYLQANRMELYQPHSIYDFLGKPQLKGCGFVFIIKTNVEIAYLLELNSSRIFNFRYHKSTMGATNMIQGSQFSH